MDILTETDPIPTVARAEIETRLRQVEEQQGVRILFAVESGSRAWGFASPDSDYDVRFVYARQRDWYLQLTPGRDVIELPTDALWDINGWDLRKALQLILRANPTLLEWLASPIRYRWEDLACAPLKVLAAQSGFGRSCFHAHRSLITSHWREHIAENEQIVTKKLIYILRSALMLDWLATHPGKLPPMNIHDLIGGVVLDTDQRAAIRDLLARKKSASETATGPKQPVLEAYVQAQMERTPPELAQRSNADGELETRADEVFRALLSP